MSSAGTSVHRTRGRHVPTALSASAKTSLQNIYYPSRSRTPFFLFKIRKTVPPVPGFSTMVGKPTTVNHPPYWPLLSPINPSSSSFSLYTTYSLTGGSRQEQRTQIRMMIGERSSHSSHLMSPTIRVPAWPLYDDPPTPTAFSSYLTASPGADLSSPYVIGDAALTSLRRFLPSNDACNITDEDADSAIDAYSCDEFRIYEFKVRRCARGRSHDWTECPYAHPGEKARRRDPRKYHYSGTACPDFRKGNCKRGDACEFAHGVFECWLHPARYRTQPCKDGVNCRRKVCFFAHTPEQLRVLPQQQSPRGNNNASGFSDSYDGSPLRQQQSHVSSLDSYLMSNALLSSSPTSTLMSPPTSPPSDSPPLSPSEGVSSLRRANGSSVNDLLMSMRHLHLSKAVSGRSSICSGGAGSWGMQQQIASPIGLKFGGGVGGFNSSGPSAPTRLGVMGSGCVGGGVGLFDGWEEPMEWVQSGKDLRAMMAEKLSKVKSLETTDEDCSGAATPDVDWVSDLVR